MTNTRQFRRPALLLAVAACAAGPLLGGCVSSDEYEGAAESARALEARNEQLAQEVSSLQGALNARNASDSELRAQNATLRQERAQLQSDIEALRNRISGISDDLSNVMASGLDPATDSALRRLAARHDVMTYDSATGRIAFASDLTFPSGSAEVRDQAKNTLADFARILSTSDGGSYLVSIEGHTDAQKPSNPNTLRNHPTNRHLSAHRAISVGDVLKANGISEDRLFTGGWGASRPLVPNGPDGKAAQNRRVEIYLLAARSDADAPAPSRSNPSASPDDAGARPARDAPMK